MGTCTLAFNPADPAQPRRRLKEMKYQKQDANGDMVFGTPNDFFIDEPAAVAQAVLTRLKLLRGEVFWDKTLGVPWFQEIMGPMNPQTYDAEIKSVILGTPGVSALLNYSSSIVNRNLSVSATISTIYGTTQISL